jgi:hypothetical protein
MKNLFDFDLGATDTETTETGVVQESVTAGSTGFTDLFGQKFNSFNPDQIISGNSKLKSGMFDMDIEEDPDLKLGYKNSGEATSPKPGRFL